VVVWDELGRGGSLRAFAGVRWLGRRTSNEGGRARARGWAVRFRLLSRSIEYGTWRLERCASYPSNPSFSPPELLAADATMAWRSDAAHDHSRVIAQCFACTDHGPGAAGFTAEEEDKLWQEASSWKGYCEVLARAAASLGHEGCLRVLYELGGYAVASLAAADADGDTPAHQAAEKGHEGCLRVLHELGGKAAASLAAADADGDTPAHYAADKGHEGCLRVLHELGGEAAASLAAADTNGDTPAHSAAANGREGCLRVLQELGGEAAASLAAADTNGDVFDSLETLHYIIGHPRVSLTTCGSNQ